MPASSGKQRYIAREGLDDIELSDAGIRYFAAGITPSEDDTLALEQLVQEVIEVLEAVCKELDLGWSLNGVVPTSSHGRQTNIRDDFDFFDCDVILFASVEREPEEALWAAIDRFVNSDEQPRKNDLKRIAKAARKKRPDLIIGKSFTKKFYNYGQLIVKNPHSKSGSAHLHIDLLLAPRLRSTSPGLVDDDEHEQQHQSQQQHVRRQAEDQMKQTWAVLQELHQREKPTWRLAPSTAEAFTHFVRAAPAEARELARVVKALVKDQLARRNWRGGRIRGLSGILEMVSLYAYALVTAQQASGMALGTLQQQAAAIATATAQALPAPMLLALRKALSLLSVLPDLRVIYSSYYTPQESKCSTTPLIMDPTNPWNNLAEGLMDGAASGAGSSEAEADGGDGDEGKGAACAEVADIAAQVVTRLKRARNFHELFYGLLPGNTD